MNTPLRTETLKFWAVSAPVLGLVSCAVFVDFAGALTTSCPTVVLVACATSIAVGFGLGGKCFITAARRESALKMSAVEEKEAAMMRLEARRKTRTPDSVKRFDPSSPEISGDLSAKQP